VAIGGILQGFFDIDAGLGMIVAEDIGDGERVGGGGDVLRIQFGELVDIFHDAGQVRGQADDFGIGQAEPGEMGDSADGGRIDFGHIRPNRPFQEHSARACR